MRYKQHLKNSFIAISPKNLELISDVLADEIYENRKLNYKMFKGTKTVELITTIANKFSPAWRLFVALSKSQKLRNNTKAKFSNYIYE